MAARDKTAPKTAPKAKKSTVAKVAEHDGPTFTLGHLNVPFREPLPGQIAALRRAGKLFSAPDKVTQGQGGLLFLDVLDALVADNDMLNQLYAGMAERTIPLEAYADCALAVLKHYGPADDEPEAPANGPVSTRRRAIARPKR